LRSKKALLKRNHTLWEHGYFAKKLTVYRLKK
jgi:hypothetical protein